MPKDYFNQAIAIKESIKVLENVGSIKPEDGFDMFCDFLLQEGYSFEEYIMEEMNQYPVS